jgi:hypothetical protein
MALAWVTGVSGSGKSSVCEVLKVQSRTAIDSDWDGYSRWVDRRTGEPVLNPPYPTPVGWLDHFGWKVRPEAVESLAAELGEGTGYLCGGFENQAEVVHLFDRLVCLFIGEATLRHRLSTRTNNHFGRHPEEMQAAVEQRLEVMDWCRARGAALIDATAPLEEVVNQVLAAVEGS